ncbi:MAG: uracil-DNA glycosylase [Lentisphaeria bacterium]
MAKPDIFDEVIELLEYRKRRGVKAIDLSDSTREGLFTDPKATATTDSGTPAPNPGGGAAATSKPAGPAVAQKPPTPKAAKALVVNEADPRDWDELMEAVQTCTKCALSQSRTHAVFGEGAINASVMFIGEGPGYHEDQSGRPFVGRAGKLLTRMIKAMQFQREDVFITNIVKCRPPGNRNPQDEEAAACMPYLNRQIDIIKPRVLVLLGAVPLRHLLGLQGITKIHGNFYKYRDIDVLPTYHPSFLLRSPQRKAEAWEDLQKVMQAVGKNPEATMRQMRNSAAQNNGEG